MKVNCTIKLKTWRPGNIELLGNPEGFSFEKPGACNRDIFLYHS